jgi:hypothetical protein
MRHGIVLFTSDRGITPAQAATAAEDRGRRRRADLGLPDGLAIRLML